MRRVAARTVLTAVLAVVTAACGVATETTTAGGPTGQVVPAGCREIPVHVSSEKFTLIDGLATELNATGPEVDGTCVAYTVHRTASGRGAALLAEGWPADGSAGPAPVLWSPASSAWGAVVNERLARAGAEPMAVDYEPIMLSPLVLAMPRPMAEALGWPEADIGWADVLRLASDPDGWGAYGHPEWGPFKLGKTNPNFSTSGLSATVAIYSAGAGTTAPLTLDDLGSASVIDFVRGVESATVHYGDTTLTFLENMLREDLAGRPLSYVSAVAVEEVSVIAYNRGDPADTGVENPTPPTVPLVAVYPREGTLYSDNPAYILDAPWVDDLARRAAEQFRSFVVDDPGNQAKVLDFGFRPGNPSVPLGEPITAANGLNPSQPKTELPVPEPAVLAALVDSWEENRKTARVLLVLDVSGSMADLGGEGYSKLELAKRAVLASLDEFKPEDEIGLWVFSTELNGTEDWLELVPTAPVSEIGDTVRERVAGLIADGGTGLYDTLAAAATRVRETYDPARINAVMLLSDGMCDDDTGCSIDPLLELLASNERDPVRIFPVAYGADADVDALRRIADASRGRLYTATDPTTIEQVLAQVMSNF